jgi:hypothetical protein
MPFPQSKALFSESSSSAADANSFVWFGAPLLSIPKAAWKAGHLLLTFPNTGFSQLKSGREGGISP